MMTVKYWNFFPPFVIAAKENVVNSEEKPLILEMLTTILYLTTDAITPF